MKGIIRHILLPVLLFIASSVYAQEGNIKQDSTSKDSTLRSDTCIQTIEGTVLDYYTQKPVNRATVRAWYNGQSSRTAARTNGNGYYKIKVAVPTVFDSLTVQEVTFGNTTLLGKITVGCNSGIKLPIIELKDMAAGCIGIGRRIIYDENTPAVPVQEDTGKKKKRRKE